MSPAEHVRIALQLHRERGTPFETAWISALRSLPKGGDSNIGRDEIASWKHALAWAKPAFQAAYLGWEYEVVQPVLDNEPTKLLAINPALPAVLPSGVMSAPERVVKGTKRRKGTRTPKQPPEAAPSGTRGLAA